jgi:phenylacetate-coenzyme A ligase PaaK-like adenylate-forming protein
VLGGELKAGAAEDHFIVEVVDPESGEPVAEGGGRVCVHVVD